MFIYANAAQENGEDEVSGYANRLYLLYDLYDGYESKQDLGWTTLRIELN